MSGYEFHYVLIQSFNRIGLRKRKEKGNSNRGKEVAFAAREDKKGLAIKRTRCLKKSQKQDFLNKTVRKTRDCL